MKILFDVDGVLIDGWHADPQLRKPWSADLQQDLGVDPARFEHEFFVRRDNPLGSMMHACVAGQRDLKEALAVVLPPLGYRGRVDDFVQYWFAKDANMSAPVFALVERLHQHAAVELFVATGQEHYRAAYLWQELGFSRYFRRMFYSAELGYLKSDQRFFQAINQAINHTTNQAINHTTNQAANQATNQPGNKQLNTTSGDAPLFFDDQPEVVDLARQAGWDAHTFNSVSDIETHPRLADLLT